MGDAVGAGARPPAPQDVLDHVRSVPGVARLVPGFREMLTARVRSIVDLDTAEPATGVDVVVRDGSVIVYIDCDVDGSRPMAHVVDDIVDGLQSTETVADRRVAVRVLRRQRP
ncbi:hypothetical protein GCM10027060_11130 [Nesterenkonia halophila]|uniref:hypothetical protein n=1 Tax=Nesterenkonia halophila TaxID=302044 RepID=UPI001292251E|nr:hypothetical protein [Nesterenkonia halophila]